MEKSPLFSIKPSYKTMENEAGRINVQRNILKQDFSSFYKEKTNLFESLSPSCRCKPKICFKRLIPSLSWLYAYNFKEWLIKDMIAGFTVAVMNIPQGMAYAMLANVDPVVGIYTAFFPVLVYGFLGTSRHVAMGTFAVVCLMTGKLVDKVSHSNQFEPTNSTLSEMPISYTETEIATAVTFMVAVYQILMYIFRLGIVCTLLSETLISGFTAGAAIHVFTSQLKDILGIQQEKIHGPFNLIFIYYDLVTKIKTINFGALVCSGITIIVLMANNEIIKPRLKKITSLPVPIELLVVLCGTLVSRYGGIDIAYGLRTVGHIQIGLPEPKFPPTELFPSVALDSAIIAVIAYIVTLSMALIFANKLKYDIDPNQELLAQGLGNAVGSMFSCVPFCASLSRSVIQETVGGVTQLASVFCAGILLVVLLWIGPFFEPLPRCILASLIIVALKGILFQVKDVTKVWRISKLDGIIWTVTYLSVIIVDIEYGLLGGLLVSIFILFLRGLKTNAYLLERIPNTEIYVQPNKYVKTESIPGIAIIHYTGSINFVNRNCFKDNIWKLFSYKLTGNQNFMNDNKIIPSQSTVQEKVIFDFRSVHYIDSAGAKAVQDIMLELKNISSVIYFVGLQEQHIETLNSTLSDTPFSIYNIFPTVHDAVVYSQISSDCNSYSIRL